jgi:hypothetical protein
MADKPVTIRRERIGRRIGHLGRSGYCATIASRNATALSHWRAFTDCGMVDRRGLCGNIYFSPDDATQSLACCWSRYCSVPISPSASCLPAAARRFNWNSVPRTEYPFLRTINTTTIPGIMRISKIVPSEVRPLKDRSPTFWPSVLPRKYRFSKPFRPNPNGF